MTAHYDDTVAAHYAAYRPPLHLPILKRAIIGSKRFSDGLDVGCGTGRSSVALAEFCERVYAVDPSQSMIEAATPHAAVSYRSGSGEHIPLPDRSIDVVTFAGSLFYADLDHTVKELRRVCRPGSLVIPYDFEVQLSDTMQALGMVEPTANSTYDPARNFSGVSAFKELLTKHDRIEFGVVAADLAHILLANRARHDAFVDRYKTTTPLLPLTSDLGAHQPITISADVYYSVHECLGAP